MVWKTNTTLHTITGIVSFLIFCQVNTAQSKAYDIISKQDTLGLLKISKNVIEDIHKYHYDIDMRVKLLVQLHLKYEINATYNKNQLLSANVDNMVNGKPHHSSTILWQDSYYILQIKNRKSQKLLDPISYSGILLFFEEPTGVERVFSEYSGHFGTLKLIGKNQYELLLHNGKKNQYVYEGGVLTRANINSSMVNFQLKLKR